MVRCAEIITPHEKIGKGIPDNWDKLNNKRTNNVYYLSRRTMASKKIIYKERVKATTV